MEITIKELLNIIIYYAGIYQVSWIISKGIVRSKNWVKNKFKNRGKC